MSRMRCRAFPADQTGATTIEWALILAGIGLPLAWVFYVCVIGLGEHYRMVTFIETLPFP